MPTKTELEEQAASARFLLAGLAKVEKEEQLADRLRSPDGSFTISIKNADGVPVLEDWFLTETDREIVAQMLHESAQMWRQDHDIEQEPPVREVGDDDLFDRPRTTRPLPLPGRHHTGTQLHDLRPTSQAQALRQRPDVYRPGEGTRRRRPTRIDVAVRRLSRRVREEDARLRHVHPHPPNPQPGLGP